MGVEVAVERYRGIAGFVLPMSLASDLVRDPASKECQRMMEWDIQCLFLDYMGTHMCVYHMHTLYCMHTYTYTHTQRKVKKKMHRIHSSS